MPFTRIAIPAGTSSAHRAAIARGVHEAMAAGIRPQDVFVYLGENDFSDWSVGGGRMSMEIAMQHEAGA